MEILLQNLWTFSLTSEEPISGEFSKRWTSFQKNLKATSGLKIRRFVLVGENFTLQIHDFRDF